MSASSIADRASRPKQIAMCTASVMFSRLAMPATVGCATQSTALSTTQTSPVARKTCTAPSRESALTVVPDVGLHVKTVDGDSVQIDETKALWKAVGGKRCASRWQDLFCASAPEVLVCVPAGIGAAVSC